MLDVSKVIVKLRIPILIISFILLFPAAFGFLNLKVNYDILCYLPSELETMKGQDILMDEFQKGAYGMFVCQGLSKPESIELADKVNAVDHVVQVINFDSITDGGIPSEFLPSEVKKIFQSEDGNTTLMFVFFDTTSSSDETMDAITEIRKIAKKECFLSSMASIALDTKNLVEGEMFAYTLIAVILTVIVLCLTTDSFMLPVLFMISIGLAIIYNLGTNFIQGDISYITMALVAILQLGVTMDYSIFLYHSYQEALVKYPEKNRAMAHAIAATIVSVTGSSLTTIAGFLAMCFMSFTLGLDMGIVMAKGVIFGVISCVTILPSLILVFDKAIQKTKHKALQIPTEGITNFVTKHYKVFILLMIALWIPAIYGNNNVNVYYKLDESIPDRLPSRQANMALEENFDMNSVSMILVDRNLSSKETRAMLDEINNVPGIAFALGTDSLIGPMIPEAIVPDEALNKLNSDNWKMILLSSEYQVATDEINEQCKTVESIVKKYDPSGMIVGEAPATKDLVDITAHDFNVVSFVSIGAIFVLILFVLKSISLPVVLVLVIEFAIYVNMAMSFFIGTTLPFIASVCVGTIQLGATVDYAILMTTRYKKERLKGVEKTEAVKIALSTSINSIFTSALGFFAATVGVAVYSDIDLIGAICMLLARGALLSMVIVIVMLPSLLMLLDKFICKTTVGMTKINDEIDENEYETEMIN